MSKLKIKNADNQITVISHLESGESVNQQELQMMNSIVLKGIMKPTLLKKNKLSYLSPRGYTLRQFLQSGITVNDFYLIFAQIVEVLKGIDKSRLNFNNLVADIDYAFYNVNTKEIHMIYQPIFSQQPPKNILQFIINAACSVNLMMGESGEKINALINFFRTTPDITALKMEQFIVKTYPDVYKQFKRIKTGQVNRFAGTDLYYRNDVKLSQEDYSDDKYKFGNVPEYEPVPEPQSDETTLLKSESTSLLTDEDGTTLLSQEQKSYPYLIRLNTFDRRDVDKPVFRIGKERSYVDYFVQNNSAVSRLHADIITRESRYYIKDNNSTNRTFVNGVAIPTEQEVEIFDGDEIVLANEPFEFHIN